MRRSATLANERTVANRLDAASMALARHPRGSITFKGSGGQRLTCTRLLRGCGHLANKRGACWIAGKPGDAA